MGPTARLMCAPLLFTLLPAWSYGIFTQAQHFVRLRACPLHCEVGSSGMASPEELGQAGSNRRKQPRLKLR